MNTPEELLGALNIHVETDNYALTHKKTSKKAYRNLLKYLNVTSYSQLEVFHRCPRKFQLAKERAAFQESVGNEISNVDFAFGHAVGAGVQNYLIHRDLEKALLNCCLAWNIDFDSEIPKKRKNIWGAMIAVEVFVGKFSEAFFDEWELLILPNGQPAIEVGVSLHAQNNFKHYLHMDVGLRHKHSRRIAVLDVKTSGFDEAEESIYANSSQALSYALVLQACLQEELVDYEVLYLVYSSTARDWQLLSFPKQMLDQAEFVKDLLFTHNLIETYADTDFFPKRGNACYEYFRRCEFYGDCGNTAGERLPELAFDKEAETTDYVVELSEVVRMLKEKRR